jgi:Leucine-rich repeat (LRR) protein
MTEKVIKIFNNTNLTKEEKISQIYNVLKHDTVLNISYWKFDFEINLSLFSNLVTFRCGGNSLTHLPSLKNTKIKYLDCEMNDLVFYST